MAFQLRANPEGEEQNGGSGGAYSVSAEPLIASSPGAASASGQTRQELPASYGTQILTLMARDPQSLFAYWDVNWAAVFSEHAPKDRKVHLRILDEQDAVAVTVEVEPMAGSCYVTVPSPGASYTAKIGYFHPANAWNEVAVSEAVMTPPAVLSDSTAVDFATVPFHLSFQRMLDEFRISKHERDSLTDVLAQLRERATGSDGGRGLTPQEQEVVQAIDDAIAQEPVPESAPANVPELSWEPHLERIFGFGNSSLSEGFGGSSRPA